MLLFEARLGTVDLHGAPDERIAKGVFQLHGDPGGLGLIRRKKQWEQERKGVLLPRLPVHITGTLHTDSNPGSAGLGADGQRPVSLKEVPAAAAISFTVPAPPVV